MPAFFFLFLLLFPLLILLSHPFFRFLLRSASCTSGVRAGPGFRFKKIFSFALLPQKASSLKKPEVQCSPGLHFLNTSFLQFRKGLSLSLKFSFFFFLSLRLTVRPIFPIAFCRPRALCYAYRPASAFLSLSLNLRMLSPHSLLKLFFLAPFFYS